MCRGLEGLGCGLRWVSRVRCGCEFWFTGWLAGWLLGRRGWSGFGGRLCDSGVGVLIGVGWSVEAVWRVVVVRFVIGVRSWRGGGVAGIAVAGVVVIFEVVFEVGVAAEVGRASREIETF